MQSRLAVRNGKVTKITFAPVSKMPPLRPRELTNFKKLVRAKADEIVHKWIDYFVLHRNIHRSRLHADCHDCRR